MYVHTYIVDSCTSLKYNGLTVYITREKKDLIYYQASVHVYVRICHALYMYMYRYR